MMDSCELHEEMLPEEDTTPETAPFAESMLHKTAAFAAVGLRRCGLAASPDANAARGSRHTISNVAPVSSMPMPMPRQNNITAPPCFFAGVCRQRAAVEKGGRSVCHDCAGTRLRGSEYPLRDAASEPLYVTGRAASEALDMVEDISQRARRGLRGGVWS